MDNKRNVTTKHQFLLLLKEMRKCPQLGRGAPTSASSKHQWDEQWEVLSAKLNSCGPPMRTAAHWKKIWSNLRARTTRRFTESLATTDKNRNPISPVHFSHQEEEIANVLGLHEDCSESPQGITVIEKVEEMSNDGESQTSCTLISETPPFDEPRIVVSNNTSISPSSTAISAVSAAVFKAVSAAASAAASTIASNAAINDKTTSAAPLTKPTTSRSKRDKGHNDESLVLLRQQITCQQDLSESLNRLANAIEFHVKRSRRKQNERAGAVLSNHIF